ncbi:MAG: GNAT family N-acetyltransferase [Deinococcus sp.]|nr:GNAT family N-acetyltransferase [Deinococcus sp.]
MELLPLTTERLLLRPFAGEDAADLHAYRSLDGVARFLLEDAWDQERTAQKLEQRRQQDDLRSGHLALACEYGGRVVGDLSLWLTDDTGLSAEIGWVFHPAVAGKGLATEAVRAALGLAFEGYALHRVAAQMDARNLASARLCERVGMQREAHLRQNWWHRANGLTL